MDFDKPKVYGDTSIADGLVLFFVVVFVFVFDFDNVMVLVMVRVAINMLIAVVCLRGKIRRWTLAQTGESHLVPFLFHCEPFS